MLELIKETKFPFMRHRKVAYAVSIVVMLIGVASVVMKGGFQLGVDFTGGRVIEYRFDQDITSEAFRSEVEGIGFTNVEVQRVGETNRDYMLRLPPSEGVQASGQASPSARILAAVKQNHPGINGEIRMEESVGPRVGKELSKKAFWAVTISLLFILAYVAMRYQPKFALGGVIALAHDVVVTLLMCSVFNMEVTIAIIAALMTIGGYSINDTVVVFDRIREEMKLRQGQPLDKVIDIAINKTLSRTILTSFTTFLTAISLLVFGGEVIHGFAFAMTVGVFFGTYSSVYIASALALEISNSANKKEVKKAA